MSHRAALSAFASPALATPARRLQLLFLLPLFVLAACNGDDERSAAARPNVVFVTVDTLRHDYTSLGSGQRADTTPFLRSLAQEGTVFENAFSMSSWTSPSMNMILTGDVRIHNDGTILKTQDHLAEVFQRHGYRTAGFIHNPILFESLGFGRGCEIYDLVPVEDRDRVTAQDMVAKGLAWVDDVAEGDAPFFLWLHPMDPHDPYRPREEAVALRPDPDALKAARAALAPKHAEMLTDAEWRSLDAQRARYAGEVLQVDRALEALWKGLEERGLAENTILVVTADHGEGLWKRPALRGSEAAAHPFPPLYMTHGIQLFSEQVHVPLLFVGPGIDRGRRESRFVDLLDVAPTLCSLLDLAPRHVMDGTPLVGKGATVPIDPVYAICATVATVTVDERWRLHVPAEDRAERFGDVPRLYDLASDPDERTSIDDPERIAAMTAMLESWKEEHRQETGAQEGSVAYYRALRSLGYGGETTRYRDMDVMLEELEAEGLLPEDGSLPGPEVIRAWEERKKPGGD